MDLQDRLARELSALVAGLAVGAAVPVQSSSDVCSTLELLLPQALATRHPQWRSESLDGFFFSSATLTEPGVVDLVGTCILIGDQTVTPFALTLGLFPDASFRSLRVRLGEPGAGLLGISGPPCTSGAARRLLDRLESRLDRVEWSFTAAVSSGDPSPV